MNEVPEVGDTANHITRSIETAWAKVIGCRFPYAPFQTTNGKELTYDKIKSDFIIINFNYLFCDRCINQLDSLVKIKETSKKTITIVSFFACDKNDIKHLTDKFKDDVYFVSNADSYINNYALDSGQPLNYILDKVKTIIYVNRSVSQTLTPYLIH
ncbi:MAG: hypothetical protein KF900_06545 [Bacteroidetes bacterium]|nr:hypothetical protein [Bacteroidota bacterium]